MSGIVGSKALVVYVGGEVSRPIILQDNQPAENVVRPFASRQQSFRVRAEGLQKIGNRSVMPADQHGFPAGGASHLVG